MYEEVSPSQIQNGSVWHIEINKLKKENKPPVKSSTPLSAQTTPKRTLNLMSTSLIVTSSSSRLSSAEKKTPSKRDSFTPKSSTPKSLSKTSSSDRLNKLNNKEQKTKDLSTPMTKSTITVSSTTVEKSDTTIEQQPATPVKSKDEKNALNAVKTEEPTELVAKTFEEEIRISDNASLPIADEKIDQGNEKDSDEVGKKDANGTKELLEVRELTPPTQLDSSDMMSASMIAKSKITTEEEAKAALAERRRLAREEAERQAELERQRLEAERIADIKQQEEEAERQRQFEEEAIHLAAEQRKAEEERLRQAIEEAKQREEDDRLKREEEEKLRIEREEAEKKAKEEAEKQRIEVAERLKREEKEREERRKRVEAIMSRTRKAGSAATPNSTPVKENIDQGNSVYSGEQNQQPEEQLLTKNQNSSSTEESNSTSSLTTSATTPTILGPTSVVVSAEPQNSQALYEQSVELKEVSLMKMFSTVNEENIKNMQQNHTSQQQQQQPLSQNVEIANGKIQHTDFPNNDVLFHDKNTSVANGNGHIGSISNKNDINILQDAVVSTTDRLIDFSIESQEINNSVNFNNNNSLLSTTNTLVTADSHEHKDISLL